MAYTNAKVRENYSRRFSITYPNEELPAARPVRISPLYEKLKAHNAVFGAAYGLEHALWFAPEGEEPLETPTFKRSNAFDTVRDECNAVRNGVGMIEISTFAKYEVTGPEAEAWISRILSNRMPKTGRIVLSPMLNPDGKLIGDFTVAKLADEQFYVFGSGIAEDYHMRWFEAPLPETGVSIRSRGLELTGLSIAGPKARDLLAKVTDADVSKQSMPFMSIKKMGIGTVPAMVGRITFTGDFGYEIWVEAEHLEALFDLLMEEGEEFELRLFGGRALNSLRLEKGFGIWATEFRPIYGAFEAGLDRFIDLSKNDFIGREAAAKEHADGPVRRLVTFEVEVDTADVVGDEPVWLGDVVVGWVTSGGYSHYLGKSVALGYSNAESLVTKDSFAIEILGVKRPARLHLEPLFDPQGERMRS